MAASFAVLTDATLLRQVTSFMDGVPLLLLEMERSLPPDEWSARHGDSALVTRFAIRRDDRRLLLMLYDVHCASSLTTTPPRRRLNFENALVWAARVGELSILAWLQANCPQLNASALLMDAAIKNGRVDVLDFLHAHYRAAFSGDTQVLGCSLAFAPRDKWLAVAEWLARHDDDYRSCFSLYVLERVIESGDAAMFAFVHARVPRVARSHLMHTAARTGNLPAVRALQSDLRSARSMDIAAQNGHLEIVRYLHDERHAACSTFAMDSAARNGFLATVKFLHEHRSEGCTKAALSGAAQQGHLAVVQFLVENRHEGDLDEALGRAQGNDVAEYLRRALSSRGGAMFS